MNANRTIFLVRIFGAISSKPRLVLCAAVMVAGLAVWSTTRIHPATSIASMLATDDPASKALAQVADRFATGDELIEPGEPHRPGFVYNSNTFSVAASVARYGGIPRIVGIARDTVESLNEALSDALASADMIITSAGVSKGDYDVVKDVLGQRGEIALWSVRMRPAKPLAFGVLFAGDGGDGSDGQPVPHLGLPGNPVSAMVAFEQFARPAIRLMLGLPVLDKPTIQAVLDDAVVNHDGRRVYARVVVYVGEDGEYRARSTGSQSSNVLTSMVAANGLAICPEDVAQMDPGEMVTVQMLDWPDDII